MKKGWKKFFKILSNKFVIIAFLFVVISLATVFAGNVIVKEGTLTTEDNFNASNVFFVNQTSGKVGIGTSIPLTKIDVAGSFRSTNFTAPSSGTGLEFGYYPTGGYGYLYTYNRNNSSYVDTSLGASGNQVYLKSNGYVGIGTTSPKNMLNVVGDTNTTGNFITLGQIIFPTAMTTSGLNWSVGNLYITGNPGTNKITVSQYLAVANGGSANHAICWKSDGVTLGYCASAINASGVCSCY